MLYGSLYKVFVKLSNQKFIEKKNYNELTIPKIFVKILLNKEKGNSKNYFSIDNSDLLIKEYQDLNLNKINLVKPKENKPFSITKNYINNLDYSLPKIKFKKNLDLIQKIENRKIKEKNDFLIQKNDTIPANITSRIFKNKNFKNIRKIKVQKINDNNRYNNNSSYNDNPRKSKICNLKYKIHKNNFFEYKDLDCKLLEQNNSKEIEKNKDDSSNIRNVTSLENLGNNKTRINLIERNKTKNVSKLYSLKDKNKLRLSKTLIKDKDKDIELSATKKRKTINLFNLKKKFLLNENISSSKKFTKLEDIDKILTKKEIKYCFNKNLFSSDDIYYFKCKMYKNQLREYFSHRINWTLITGNNYNENITINFEWKYYSNKINYKEYKYDPALPLKKFRMVNLFEKNDEVGNKKHMFINLINYCDKENINVFEIVPFTMIISNSNNIQKNLNKIEKIINFVEKNKNNKKNLISKQKYNEIFDEDKLFEHLKNQYIYIDKNFISNKNYWIIKPPDLYQGKCIEICDSFEQLVKLSKNIFKGVDKKLIPEQLNTITNNDINENNETYKNDTLLTLNSTTNCFNSTNYGRKKINRSRIYCSNEIIIQKYLDNPLLYNNRKFDIRCFVLLDSNLNLFFCKEGHLKGSSELYNLNNSNKYIHITNYSLQKNSNNFQLYEQGNEMSYNDFKNFLVNEKISLDKFDSMITQMKYLIKISFKSVSKKFLKEKPGSILCFEIFGYDFILDNDFKLWILEINNNPGLSISSPVIEKLVPRMMDDAFRLTIDKVFNTKYCKECIDNEGKYKTKYKLNGFTDDENIFEFLCNIS